MCYRIIVLVARAQTAGTLLPLRLPMAATMQHHKTLTHHRTMKTLQQQVGNDNDVVHAQPAMLLVAMLHCVH